MCCSPATPWPPTTSSSRSTAPAWASHWTAACPPTRGTSITFALAAQDVMREHIRGVGFCLMMATMLHSIAVGNLLPAWVRVACVDINPATVTKLMDRGSTQTVGIVSDAEPFLRALVVELDKG